MNNLVGLKCILTLGVAVCVSSAHGYSPALPLLVVATDKGQVEGFFKEGYRQFQGIPYAKPPINTLRWQPPVEADRWAGKRNATHFANTCATNEALFGFGAKSTSEDCLYLNVYTPAIIDRLAPLPVMVVIPGGGLRAGSGNEYNMSQLVRKNTIVVSINYRLGVLGYFSHPALDHEGHPAINYGTMDQQAALRWVKQNISQFGGDRNNVTLYGESAGGQAVLTQLASPSAAGLFQKAIVSSGSYLLNQRTAEQYSQFGVQLAKNVGCGGLNEADSAACLRHLPTQTLLDNGIESIPGMEVDADGAIIDGKILPKSLGDAFSSGQYNQVPIINGFNADEGTFFVGAMEIGSGQPINLQSFATGLKRFFSVEKTEKLLELVKHESSSGNVGADYARLFGRAKFICHTPMTSDLLVQHAPVYGYLFGDITSPTITPPVSFPYGAAHINDLQYIFKDFHGATGLFKPLDSKQRDLSALMVNYFTNFAKTSNPNSKGLPQWQEYDAQRESVIFFHPDLKKVKMVKDVSSVYQCDGVKEVL